MTDSPAERDRRGRLAALAARLAPDFGPIRDSRDFRLLYGGQAANSTGAMVCFVAMPYQAYQISHSSLVVGLLSCAEVVPVLVAGLLGGALADTVERRRLILITQACSAACIAGLGVNALAGGRLWLVFVLAAALAATVAFVTVALQSYKTASADPVDALREE